MENQLGLIASLKPYALSADDICLLCQSPILLPNGNHGISQQSDKNVWEYLFSMLEIRVQHGDFTAIDATNSKTVEMNRYKELAKQYKYRIACVDFTNVPIGQCKRQNSQRPKFKRVRIGSSKNPKKEWNRWTALYRGASGQFVRCCPRIQ